MIRIGLTGGIGMGKSTAAELLVQRGIAVVDTDRLAREVVAPGSPALDEIGRQFGPGVIARDGSLRRDALASLVFADESKRHQLEAILHPRIRELWLAFVRQQESERSPACVVVIPLLFETGAEKSFDHVVCTACAPGTQLARLRARGWSEGQCRQRLAAQWPTQRKVDCAHTVIWTEVSRDIHGEQWDRVLLQWGLR